MIYRTPEETANKAQGIMALNSRQAECKHFYRLVPNGLGGFMPYLQCAKCGKRVDHD